MLYVMVRRPFICLSLCLLIAAKALCRQKILIDICSVLQAPVLSSNVAAALLRADVRDSTHTC